MGCEAAPKHEEPAALFAACGSDYKGMCQLTPGSATSRPASLVRE